MEGLHSDSRAEVLAAKTRQFSVDRERRATPARTAMPAGLSSVQSFAVVEVGYFGVIER
jgi:hypothetical protein